MPVCRVILMLVFDRYAITGKNRGLADHPVIGKMQGKSNQAGSAES